MRKKTKRKVWALVNPITHAIAGAAITDTASLDKLRLRELAAIEAFRTGRASKTEWLDMADLLNICETLARDGIGPEALGPTLRAQESLAACHERHFDQGKSLALTGPELQSLREAFQYHDIQRLSISRSRYEQAIQKTANRLKGPHPDVKVCTA